ncbi:MAG TPA: hypothetical protein PK523_00115 [Elusimicrobiales bacterium]|nr:hypothetical protein [Elusimicrobiales bacterium]
MNLGTALYIQPDYLDSTRYPAWSWKRVSQEAKGSVFSPGGHVSAFAESPVNNEKIANPGKLFRLLNKS